MPVSDSKPIKNQLRWRCRRGMQEMDILLLRYLEDHFDNGTVQQQQTFARLLEQQDDILWDWLSGRVVPGDSVMAKLVSTIRG